MFAAGVVPSPKFELLPGVYVCWGELGIRIALHDLGPSRTYTLAVHPREFLSACNEVRQWINAPFAQQINVVEDPDLDPFAWYVTANGRSVGSAGA